LGVTLPTIYHYLDAQVASTSATRTEMARRPRDADALAGMMVCSEAEISFSQSSPSALASTQKISTRNDR